MPSSKSILFNFVDVNKYTSRSWRIDSIEKLNKMIETVEGNLEELIFDIYNKTI